MSYDGPPIKELTDEWVELFEDESNRRGPMWMLAKMGYLPCGVDPNDERVRGLLGPDWRPAEEKDDDE